MLPLAPRAQVKVATAEAERAALEQRLSDSLAAPGSGSAPAHAPSVRMRRMVFALLAWALVFHLRMFHDAVCRHVCTWSSNRGGYRPVVMLRSCEVEWQIWRHP